MALKAVLVRPNPRDRRVAATPRARLIGEAVVGGQKGRVGATRRLPRITPRTELEKNALDSRMAPSRPTHSQCMSRQSPKSLLHGPLPLSPRAEWKRRHPAHMKEACREVHGTGSEVPECRHKQQMSG